MANNIYTAVASNQHNMTIYDAVSGNYIASINVTSGQIIGQPIMSPNTITVTFNSPVASFILFCSYYYSSSDISIS